MQYNKEYIPREIFNDVAQHLQRPEITLITGSRQVGKTVLLTQLRHYLLQEQNVSPEHIFSYNLDLVQDQQTLQDQTAFLQFLRDRSQKSRLYVFVDEAQKVPEAPRFFKGIYDSEVNAKLILTGSASLEAKARFKETLAGRKRIFALPPFTFPEFVSIYDATLAEMLAKRDAINPVDIASLVRLYKEYMRFGGYPRVVLAKTTEEKEAQLQEIYSSYVEKDAIGFWGVQHPPAFNRLLRLISSQVGQLVNIHELATHLSVDRQTVERYLMLLQETFVLQKLAPFFRNPRQEVVKAGKIYFLDTGIRNIILGNTSDMVQRVDCGQLFENAVFIELERVRRNHGGRVYFWRTKQKAEVDFIWEQGQALFPIEAKYGISSLKASRGLQSFMQSFRITHALFIALEQKAAILPKKDFDLIYPFQLEKNITE